MIYKTNDFLKKVDCVDFSQPHIQTADWLGVIVLEALIYNTVQRNAAKETFKLIKLKKSFS